MIRTNFAILLLIGWIISPTLSSAQPNAYNFEQIDSLQKIDKRIIVVFISTDWCKYCHMMKNTTLKNDRIIKNLNKNYYFINLNGEERQDITFNNHTFKYQPTGANIGSHELAQQLGTIGNQLSYPTLCFLNADMEIVFQYAEVMGVKEMEVLLEKIR